jgi:branched-chain amino acid transport system permease protein
MTSPESRVPSPETSRAELSGQQMAGPAGQAVAGEAGLGARDSRFGTRHVVGLALLLVAALLAALPLVASSYVIVFMVILFVHVVMAASYDLVGGYMGYINLGHASFFGLGAYAFGISASRGLPLAPAIGLAALSAVALALVVSYPLFRLRGVYFAIASFGLIVLLRQLALNLGDLTNGVAGMSIPLQYDPRLTFYLTFGLSVAALATNFLISRSHLGLALACIRDDEEVADGIGINIFRCKLTALAISAAYAGVIGAIFAWFLIFINPDSVFGLEIALLPIVMAMLGGSGTVVGPLLGAVFVQLLQELLWTNIEVFRSHLHLATYGVVLALVGLMMPKGFANTRPVRDFLKRIGLWGYG